MSLKKNVEVREKLKKFVKNIGLSSIIIIGLSGIAGLILLFINFYYINPNFSGVVYGLFNILITLMIVAPATIIQYGRYKKVRGIEERFPDFLRDVVEGIRGGMILTIAIKHASINNYGHLNPYINKMVAQISWGIPFDEALNNFRESLNSRVIDRAISTIIQAHKSGGDLGEVLTSVSESIIEVDKIRRERTSRIYSQMMTGYIIFFVFVGVMIGLQKFLLPALKFGSVGAITGGETLGRLFVNLAVIQGFFSGLSIGKLAEGTISAGIKHSVILSLIGYSALTLVA